MYNDDYLDYDSLDEFADYDELDDFRDEFSDEDEFTGFIPPYGCPYYRQFPGGGLTPPRPPRPPFGPPSGGPQGGPPFGPPSGGTHGGPQGGPPSGPPPGFTPPKAQAQGHVGIHGGIAPQAVSPVSLRPCRFRFVYIWLRNGTSFWAWITFVGRTSIAGYRWNGRRWVYFGIDTRRIDAFICY